MCGRLPVCGSGSRKAPDVAAAVNCREHSIWPAVRAAQAAQRDRNAERQQKLGLQEALDEAHRELEALQGEAAAAAALRDELAAR